MSKKKVYAIVLCLVLLIAVTLPGTLATDATQAEPSADTTPAPEEPGTVQMPNEVTFVSGEKEGEQTTEGQTTENDSTGESTDAPAPVCNCEPVDGVHADTCPLNPDYKAPEAPKTEGEETQNPDQTNSSENTPENPETPEQKPEEQKECTCDPKPAEGEAHKEGCPFYVKPEEQPQQPAELTHIDSCTAECTGENCACACHLFKRIMACTTLEAIDALVQATPEEQLNTLTADEIAQIEAYMQTLVPEPLPAIVIEPSAPPVESEVSLPIVNYTYVAPFGEPVTGGQN